MPFKAARHHAGLAAVSIFALSVPALAEEPSANEEGVRVFEPEYYDQFDPVSPLDMVFRTPGFSPQEQDGGRGLSGVRSNILINGERPPPKGQSIRQQLREMSLGRIERIELIDAGARLDLDMQGYPQVLNVVTVADPPAYYEMITSLTREGTGDERQDNERTYEVEATGSLFWNQNELKLRGEARSSDQQSPSGFVAIDPANPIQRIRGLNRSESTDHGFELSASFDLANDSSLSFNGEFSSDSRASSPIDFEASEGALDAVTETRSDEEKDRDIAAEYRRPLGEGGTLMAALVAARSTEQAEDSLTANGTHRASFEDRESGETAARIRITRTPTERLTLRITATSALNFIDGGFRLFEDGVEQPVEGSARRVDEDRRSLESAIDWSIGERWTLHGTLGAESYEIESGGISSGAQTDPKGEVTVSFRPRPRTTLSLETTRQIGQLSFGQFLASSSLSSEILTAGASALEPQRSRRHRASYDRRFGDVGVLRFELSRQEIENPVRSVALSDSVIVAQNTSPRTVDQVSASIELPFEGLGRDDLVLTANARIAESETIDPVTGETREASGLVSRYWSLGLRKDPGDSRLAWSFSVARPTPNLNYAVRRIRDFNPSREWQAEVEWEPIDGVRIRTRLQGPSTRRERSYFFDAVREPGLDPSFISETYRTVDRSASISVQWRRRDNLEITGSLSTRPKVRVEESLTTYGGPAGPILTTETETTPRAQVSFRVYR